MGDVDYLKFSDEEKDEFKEQKGTNVLDNFVRRNEDTRIDKKYNGWFNKILSHKVKPETYFTE